MMTYTIEQLALLPEDRALERWFDSRNYRITRIAFVVASLTAFITAIALASGGHPVRLAISILNMFLLGALFLFRGHPLLEINFRPAMIAWMVFEYALFLLVFQEWAAAMVLSSLAFPFLLAFLRFRPSQYLALVAVFLVSGIWAGLTLKSLDGLHIAVQLFLAFFLNGGIGAAGFVAINRARTRFLRQWSVVARRERERVRMTEELADARKIQLAMLPDSTPSVEWADFSSVSLPATEVGGDYYDFFVLPGGEVAAVIGDVAGHGVASGLVLAGIKSGLFLLRDSLDNPLQVVEKLNSTARDWLRWRMLVTVLVAVIDPRARRLRVVTAGHIPLLHYSAAAGTTRQIGRGSLPLGTRLAPRYCEEQIGFDSGDTILLYTDGVPELQNEAGESFGETRIAEAFRSASAADRTAGEIRDSILRELSMFRGANAQGDDLTLVVARLA